jgi:hypothetical protein
MKTRSGKLLNSCEGHGCGNYGNLCDNPGCWWVACACGNRIPLWLYKSQRESCVLCAQIRWIHLERYIHGPRCAICQLKD